MKHIIYIFLVFFFFNCEQKLEYNPPLPITGNYVIFEEFISSSRLEEVKEESHKEKTGTAFEIHTNVIISKNDSGVQIKWEPKEFLSNGWNKNLLAEIHQKRINLQVKFDTKGNLLEFSGFNKLPELLHNIKLPENLRHRLLDRMDTTFYKDLWLDRYTLSTLLEPGIYQRGQYLPVESINSRLKTIAADSVIVTGERNARNNPCIEYTVHYSKKGSFKLSLEEFIAVHKKNLISNKSNWLISQLQIRTHNFMTNHSRYGKSAKPGLVDELPVKGTWRFSVDLDTGIPCYEFKKEEASVALVDSISNKINVKFYKTNENGFKTF